MRKYVTMFYLYEQIISLFLLFCFVFYGDLKVVIQRSGLSGHGQILLISYIIEDIY